MADPADPVILGFDTSAAHCAAAVIRGDRLLAARHEEMGRGQAERLFALLEEVLAESGIGWADLDAIGVGTGPGNFTGIRIAVAAARGLALSLGIPAIGVGLAEAMALDLPRPCRVVLPARAGQVIWQDFAPGDEDPPGAPPAPRPGPQQAPQDDLPPGPPEHPPRHPVAVAIARIAARRRTLPGQPRPAPIYLRPADALPAREHGPVMLP